MGRLIQIIACFGITLLVVDLYLFILLVLVGNGSAAVRIGFSGIVLLLSISFSPVLKPEVINIIRNIKENYKRKK